MRVYNEATEEKISIFEKIERLRKAYAEKHGKVPTDIEMSKSEYEDTAGIDFVYGSHYVKAEEVNENDVRIYGMKVHITDVKPKGTNIGTINVGIKCDDIDIKGIARRLREELEKEGAL